MDPASTLPNLLAAAWLLPLLSFALILFFGKNMGQHGQGAARLAVGAIVASCVLSFVALFVVWLPNHPLPGVAHDGQSHGGDHEEGAAPKEGGEEEADHASVNDRRIPAATVAYAMQQPEGEQAAAEEESEEHANNPPPTYYTGRFFFYPGPIAQFGNLKLELSYYIDALTVTMFCMVTLIASCVHFYAIGYMHDELHEPYVDHEVTLSNGEHLRRKGRYWRFFQYLSVALGF